MDANELFAKHQNALIRYLTRYSGDPDVAADATQEAYLRLVRSPPRRDDNVRAWLFTVGTNVVKDGWRRAASEKRLRDAPELAPAPDPAPDPQAVAERSERARLAREMLAKASEREREILLLWAEGFQHWEIAEAVGTTKNAIGPTIARALKKLSKHIDKYRQEDV